MNPFDILKNAKAIQEQVGRLQEEMSAMVVSGSSGGGIVSLTMNGQFEILSLHIDPVAVDGRDIPMLQDLIIAAHTDAQGKIREALKDRIGPLAGGFPGL